VSLADEYRAILREAQDAANNVRGGIQDAYDRATGASGSVGRSGNGRVLPNRRLAPNQQAPLNYPSADELSADPRVYSATMYGASHPVGPPRLPPAPTPSMALSPLLANPITRRTLEDMQAGRGVKGGQAKFSPPAPASYDLPPELSPSPAPAPFFPNGAPPPPHINRYAPPANDPFGRGRPPSWLQGRRSCGKPCSQGRAPITIRTPTGTLLSRHSHRPARLKSVSCRRRKRRTHCPPARNTERQTEGRFADELAGRRD
jgi:hypothetical protein